MRKRRMVLTLLFLLLGPILIESILKPFTQVQASMVADSGSPTIPNEFHNRIIFTDKQYGVWYKSVFNGLFSYRFQYENPTSGDYMVWFSAQKKDKTVRLFDTYSGGWRDAFVRYNGSNIKYIHTFSNVSRTYYSTKDYFQTNWLYHDADYPIDVNVYARLYARKPILNVTVLLSAPASTTTEIDLSMNYARPEDGGQHEWFAIYIPGIGLHNYSDPATSRWVQIINNTNKADWNDNYLFPWFKIGESVFVEQPALAFVNRTQINYVQVFEDTAVGNITKLNLRTVNDRNRSFTFYYLFVQNTTVINIDSLKAKVAGLAHMAITETDIAYTKQSETESTQTWKVSAIYTNRTLGGWNLEPNTKLPTFFKDTGDIYGLYGYIAFVSNNSTFNIPKNNGIDYETSSALQYARNVLNYLISPNFYVNTTFAKGWRQTKGSNIIDILEATWVPWSLYEFGKAAGERSSSAPYIKDFLDFLVSQQATNGSVPFTTVDSSNGQKTGSDQGVAFTAFILGYEMLSDSTYLRSAEKHVNYFKSNFNSLRSLYRSDIQIFGLLRLYAVTRNSTYRNWIDEYIDYLNAQLYSAPNSTIAWFGSDVSMNNHANKAVAYILNELGDETSTLNGTLRKALNYDLITRTVYGGLVQSFDSTYPLYPVHQTFAINAQLLYLKYLLKNNILDRTLFKASLENWKWIEGHNEKSYDFFNNTEGSTQRSIYLSDGIPTVQTSQSVYDQAEAMTALTRISQIQNDIFLYDQGFRTTTEPRIFKSTGMISSINYDPNKLVFVVDSLSGTKSTTRVYVGDNGKPTKVLIGNIEQPIDYDSSTKILTITATHSANPAEIVVDWNPYSPKASFFYSPLSPYLNDTVTFNASSSRPNGGNIDNYQWDFGDGFVDQGVIVTHMYDTAGTYKVTLNVTDSEGLWNSTTTTVTVSMPPPPSIWKVEHSPELLEYYEAVTITANITSQKSGIGMVILNYFNGSRWTNITMTIKNQLYVAKIPVLPYGTTVQYKVYASNDLGNWAETNTFSYTVADTFPPDIGLVQWSPEEPSAGEEVIVSAQVSEPALASGVKNVTLLWRVIGEEIQSSTMIIEGAVWKATIPAQNGDTFVYFVIESCDYAGNCAESQWYNYGVKGAGAGLPLFVLAAIAATVTVLIGVTIYVARRGKAKDKVIRVANFLETKYFQSGFPHL